MRILCYMYGKTRENKIKNNNIIESVGITPIVKNRLKWFDHVKRSMINFVLRVEQKKKSQITRNSEKLEKNYRKKLLKKILRLTN